MNDIRTRPLMTHNLLRAYGVKPAAEPRSSGFGALLDQTLQRVNEKQQAAGLAVDQAIRGETQDLHRVMIAQEEASITFELMMEVRNKLLEAYQQIMQMQV